MPTRDIDLASTQKPAGRNVIAAIGIDRYRHWPRLTNAVGDATGTVEMFRRLGFEQLTPPLLNESATAEAIHSLVTDNLRALSPDDSLVLFFAGHGSTQKHHIGDQVIKTGYLIPADAARDGDKLSSWIDLEVWLRAVSLLPAKHILVVLDACYSGIALDPVIKWRTAGAPQDQPLQALRDRCSRRIITSALDDQVALDTGPLRGHSLFTGCLLQTLRHGAPSTTDGVITGTELGLCLQRLVQTYPSSRQTPDFGAFGFDDRGEIVLPVLDYNPANAAETVSLPRPPRTARHSQPEPDNWAGNSGIYIGWPPPSPPAPGPLSANPPTAAAPRGPEPVPQRRWSARTRATTASAALLMLIGFGLAAWFGRVPGPNPSDGSGSGSVAVAHPVPPRHKIVIGVNRFGGALPGVVANRGLTAEQDSLFKAAKLDVEIRWIDGSKERLTAFDDGQIDIMLLTVDYLAYLAPRYHAANKDLKAFFMVDWSRGNLGIIAKPEITSIEELKDAKVATTEGSASHYLLLSLLQMSSLTPDEVDRVHIVKAPKTPATTDLFASGKADAAATWEPFLTEALAKRPGHVLITTSTATHLVADVLFARASFLTEHQDEMTELVRVWLEGAAQLKQHPEQAVPMLAKAFDQPPEVIRDLIKKTKPASYADNRDFFGLQTLPAPYFDLYDTAAQLWQKQGAIQAPVAAHLARWMKPLEALAAEHTGEEPSKEFSFSGCPMAASTPLLKRNVSIHFASGQSAFDLKERPKLDELEKILKRFGNACVQVIGYADARGSTEDNQALSKQRAQSVVGDLAKRFDRNQFIATGGGAEGPAADNADARRTDFLFIANDCTGCQR